MGRSAAPRKRSAGRCVCWQSVCCSMAACAHVWGARPSAASFGCNKRTCLADVQGTVASHREAGGCTPALRTGRYMRHIGGHAPRRVPCCTPTLRMCTAVCLCFHCGAGSSRPPASPMPAWWLALPQQLPIMTDAPAAPVGTGRGGSELASHGKQPLLINDPFRRSHGPDHPPRPQPPRAAPRGFPAACHTPVSRNNPVLSFNSADSRGNRRVMSGGMRRAAAAVGVALLAFCGAAAAAGASQQRHEEHAPAALEHFSSW